MRGYTLIEAMVAIAILGILCAMVVSNYDVLEAPLSTGGQALSTSAATDVLAREAASIRATGPDGLRSVDWRVISELPIEVRRTVTPDESFSRVELEARWRVSDGSRSVSMIVLVPEAGQ